MTPLSRKVNNERRREMACFYADGVWVCEIEYVRRALEAQRRIRRGERQLYCSMCGGLWRWPEECGHRDRLTPRQFAALARLSAR